MSDLRPRHTEIELGGKKYGMLFDLNAIDELQDKFDAPLTELADIMKDERKVFKVLKTMLTVLINEAIDDSESGEPHVDEKFIGRKITMAEIPQLKDKVFAAFTNSVPKLDDDDPNPQSE